MASSHLEKENDSEAEEEIMKKSGPTNSKEELGSPRMFPQNQQPSGQLGPGDWRVIKRDPTEKDGLSAKLPEGL